MFTVLALPDASNDIQTAARLADMVRTTSCCAHEVTMVRTRLSARCCSTSVTRRGSPEGRTEIQERTSQHMLRHADTVVLNNEPELFTLREQADCYQPPISGAFVIFSTNPKSGGLPSRYVPGESRRRQGEQMPAAPVAQI